MSWLVSVSISGLVLVWCSMVILMLFIVCSFCWVLSGVCLWVIVWVGSRLMFMLLVIVFWMLLRLELVKVMCYWCFSVLIVLISLLWYRLCGGKVISGIGFCWK